MAYPQAAVGDDGTADRAAKAWSGWEGETITLVCPNIDQPTSSTEDISHVAFARDRKPFLCPQWGCWRRGKLCVMPTNSPISTRYHPTVATHCHDPAASAWQLQHKAWPTRRLPLIEGAGHAFSERAFLIV